MTDVHITIGVKVKDDPNLKQEIPDITTETCIKCKEPTWISKKMHEAEHDAVICSACEEMLRKNMNLQAS